MTQVTGQVTIGTDGRNQLKVTGTRGPNAEDIPVTRDLSFTSKDRYLMSVWKSSELDELTWSGEVFEAVWRNKLTDGVFMPALHAWLDSGGGPLLIGDIVAEIHFPAA